MRRLLIVMLLAAGTTLFAQSAEHAEHEGKAEQAKGEIEVPDSLKWANFALLAIGLGYMLAKFLPKAFADRTATIQKDIKEAERLKADAEKRAAEVEARVAALGSDIEKFRVETTKEMASEGERIRQETVAQIKRVEEQASLEIETAGKLARRELSRHAAELALKMAEERLRARLDHTAESGLVDGFVAELSRQGSNN
jgi:F-type H+-transporting ATPase subunit b